MKVSKFKVLLYLKKSGLDKQGKAPIMGRMMQGSVNGQVTLLQVFEILLEDTKMPMPCGSLSRKHVYNMEIIIRLTYSVSYGRQPLGHWTLCLQRTTIRL